MLSITTHPGIGDISWLYSKLVNCGRKLDFTIAEDHKTRRAITYVSILPQVEKADYGDMDDYRILAKTWNGTYGEVIKAESQKKRLFLSANNWLGEGNRLEGFMSDLPTDFHYEICTKEEDKKRAAQLLPADGKYFGIYTASLGANNNWDGWSAEEWLEFMSRVYREFPQVTFVFIGAKWDMDFAELILPKISFFPNLNLIGKTPDMSLVIEILKRLDYLVGFASGMGILSNVLNKPTCMLYPFLLRKLIYSWPCPVSLATGTYAGFVWDRPVNVYKKILPVLERSL